MARENQALHISLIVFVLMTLGLGVGMFRYYQLYDESSRKGAQDRDEANTAQEKVRKKDEELNTLKKMIGAADSDDVKKISELYEQDMKSFAATVPEKSRVYRNALEFVFSESKTRTAELADAKAEIDSWKAKYRDREATKDQVIKKFQEEAKKASDDLASERAKYKQEREKMAKDQAQLIAQLQTARKQNDETVAAAEVKVQEAVREREKIFRYLQDKNAQLKKALKEDLDTPDGEITWVNQRSGVVWVDLGRADSLNKQTTFNVYDSDVLDLKSARRKAIIEITQIRGDHLAEGRIVENKVEDPIIPGDKIETPIWSPGDKRHFALAGFMDLDKDGGSDRDTVRTLITTNGGIIDAELDDKGKITGEMTATTRFLVLGDPPKDQANPEVLANYTKMIKEADRLGVDQISLSELAQRMGWKNETQLATYGVGANPDQFPAKPRNGFTPKVNPGPLDNRDRFPPRRPLKDGTTF